MAKQTPQSHRSSAVWEEFKLSPNSPTMGQNPVTKLVNMDIGNDGCLRRRGGFTAVTPNGATDPDNHISAYLVNSGRSSDLMLKSGDTIYYFGNDEFKSIDASGANYSLISGDNPGSFALYGGEVYFCQGDLGQAIFSYDGSTVRSPGVPAIGGGYIGSVPDVYSAQNLQLPSGDYCAHYCTCCSVDSEGNIGGCTVGEFVCCNNTTWGGNCGIEGFAQCSEPLGGSGGCKSGCSCEDSELGFEHQCSILYSTAISGTLFCWHVPTTAHNNRGEKTLNVAFRVGLYDRKRKTFGKACDPKAVIRFPPTAPTTTRYQYQIVADRPEMTSLEDDYDIAIWCSTGKEVMTYTVPNSHFPGMLYNQAHGMSNYMASLTYLENIWPGNTSLSHIDVSNCPGSSMCLYRDNESLSNSGHYTDQYERPVPSHLMAILSNGTAIYMYPLKVDGYNASAMKTYNATYEDNPYEDVDSGVHLNGAEYSVGHPEQIGRLTNSQSDTFAPMPELKGKPIRAWTEGTSTMLITRKTIYQIGQKGKDVQVAEMGGPGVLNPKSLHPVSNGMLYVGDEGPILLQGGKPINLLTKLGFDGWIRNLTDEQKDDIRVGMIESENKILISMPIEDTTDSYRILMHDVGKNFTSEWWVGGSQTSDPATELTSPGSSGKVNYMASHRADSGYRFLTWVGNSPYKYDPTERSDSEDGTVASYVELWVNENPDMTKQMDELVIDLGKNTKDANLTVRVSTFDNPHDVNETGAENALATAATNIDPKLGRRFMLPYFLGMRGKYIRVRIESTGELDWSLAKVVAHFHYDLRPTSMAEMAESDG